MKDVIRIMGMSFYGFHGVTAAEKETGRRYEVDCELEVDFSKPGSSDQLVDTIDYTEIYSLIKEEVEGTAFALLEGLATSLAAKVLDRFAVYRVTLRVRKMTPPIAGDIKYVEAEITRYKADVSKLNKDNKQKE
ncbi:MAG: dihydroneopterin aldolase [candidate division Zixibacteria bacterium]|nr:dihydroneopterin aldolase [candidate division Zixibacteria bacterium]